MKENQESHEKLAYMREKIDKDMIEIMDKLVNIEVFEQ